jgi:hypothetical protein
MSRLDDLKKNLRPRLERLYGEQAEQCLERVAALVERIAPSIPAADPPIWDERDVVLITYGDQVQNPGEPSLRTLHRFLTQRRLDEVINTFPSSITCRLMRTWEIGATFTPWERGFGSWRTWC